MTARPGPPSNWRDFWDGPHAVYVNDRHKLLHARLIAQGIAPMIPSSAAQVLDHGCGEALGAPDIARLCGRLHLCDGAPGIRERLRERLKSEPNIAVLAPEDIDQAIPDASLDLVVAHSLAQYLSLAELRRCLALWRAKLAPAGCVLLGDIIPRQLGPVADAAALLRFGIQGGFFFAALTGLARVALSPYRGLRRDIGLACYDETEMLTVLAQSGFAGERRVPNLGHNQARMSFLARPRG